jgi:hypothetical protein
VNCDLARVLWMIDSLRFRDCDGERDRIAPVCHASLRPTDDLAEVARRMRRMWAVTSSRMQSAVRIRLPQTIFALVACALTLALAAPPAVAAGGCGGPAQSALNQYCESIPTARGSQPPRAGTPALGTSLPSATVRRIDQAAGGSDQAGPGSDQAGRGSNQAGAASDQAGHSAPLARERALLTLPAPNHVGSTRQAAVTARSALPLWLILLLVAAGLALATAAAARWRRSHVTED